MTKLIILVILYVFMDVVVYFSASWNHNIATTLENVTINI